MDEHGDPQLRAKYGPPSERAVKKQLDRLDRHCRRFVELSPFFVIGTTGADGRQDVSPRGDAPGAVVVLDERTLLLPDRPGNRRLDTLTNVAAGSGVGLLFFVPGVDETLRVNGSATITDDPELLARCAVAGRRPLSALVVHVEEAYLHCAKALLRSHLWKGDFAPAPGTMPSLGRMISEQIGDPAVSEADAAIAKAYRDTLY